jgi:hypothetical protein
MWRVVRIEVKISAYVGGFFVDFRGQSCPFSCDQKVQERDRTLRFYFHSELDGRS